MQKKTAGELLPYKDPQLSFEARAKDLVSRMTVEEKVGQMLYTAPAIPRLGVPSYNWWNEALHGVARAGTATVFPQAVGMAATFDEALLERVGDVISTEGRARFHAFQAKGDHDIYKGLTFWSPNVNIFRDPRWGRGQETFGEDPYLTGLLGKAFVRGVQGNDPKYLKAAACAKHFAVHSGPELERHEFDARVGEKDLRETYLPAFRELVTEAGVAGVMGAYNRVNGEPCCGSKTLLRKILRGEWGFTGYITSDCWAIKDFHEGHGVTKNAPESCALALVNTLDTNCGSMFANLLIALRDGLVTEEEIDRAVERLMLIRLRLGLFDDDRQVPYASIPFEENDSPAHRAFALDVSEKSLVLLKNKDAFLPLDASKLRSVAVIGPNADSREALIGNYHGTSSGYTTVLEGIRRRAGAQARVYYAEGCDLVKDRVEDLALPGDRIAEAVTAAEHADVAVVCLGLNEFIEGEEGDPSNPYKGGDKSDLNLPGLQQKLLEAVAATGTPVVLVLLAGSALAVGWAEEHVQAIVQAWYPGQDGGEAVASLLFGDFSPSGRLPVTFYRSTEELPDFHDYTMKNRTYRYMRGEALYPFGYGLSYASFAYEKLALSAEALPAGETLRCTVTVRNTGHTASDEIAQLYLRPLDADDGQPRWSLKGTCRLTLAPGEKKAAVFALTPRQLALFDAQGRCAVRPGRYEIFVGGRQPDARSEALTGSVVLSARFAVTGEEKELPN